MSGSWGCTSVDPPSGDPGRQEAPHFTTSLSTSAPLTQSFTSCKVQDQRWLRKIVKTARRIVGAPLGFLQELYQHPPQGLFSLMPSGKRSSRILKSFSAQAVRVLNGHITRLHPLHHPKTCIRTLTLNPFISNTFSFSSCHILTPHQKLKFRVSPTCSFFDVLLLPLKSRPKAVPGHGLQRYPSSLTLNLVLDVDRYRAWISSGYRCGTSSRNGAECGPA